MMPITRKNCKGGGKTLIYLAAALLAFVPMGAWAGVWNLGNVTYDLQHLGADDGGDVLQGTLNSNQKLSINDGGTITLSDATIDRMNSGCEWAGLTCEGSATIILEGDNTVNGFGGGYPGIYVPPGKTLTIKGSGTLNATGNGGGAGIGGGYNINSGNIVIEGTPTVNATGTWYGAGIGGGYSSTCGTITIKGGTITARGNQEGGAGIGGGCYGTCGNIRIEGGTVWAYGGYNTGTGASAPGIGAGDRGTCGNITITTGITAVRALRYRPYATDYIGKGLHDSTCGTVTIPSGLLDYTIAPDSNLSGRAIVRWVGSLDNLPASTTAVTAFDGTTITGTLSRKCKITIASGAKVTLDNATIDGASLNEANNDSYKYAGITCEGGNYITLVGSNTISGFYTGYPGIHVPSGQWVDIKGSGTLNVSGNGQGAAGIGGGWELACGSIYIYGSPTVVATGGTYATGIGGGYNSSCRYIYIYGSANVTASAGNQWGAGIGSGYCGTCEKIAIYQTATVTATGGQYAAGIGSGHSANAVSATCGDISIYGSANVTATGGEKAAAIGSGYNGACGDISISGGTVAAYGGTESSAIGKGNGATCGNITIREGITKVAAKRGTDVGYSAIAADSSHTRSWDKTLLAVNNPSMTVTIEPWDGDLSKLSYATQGQESITATNNMTLTGSTSSQWVQVNIADGATVTLDNASIVGTNGNSDEYKHAAITCLGNATITLVGENTLKGFYEDYPAIYVPVDSTLTIQGSGSLDASSNGYAAGIGAGFNYTSGNHPNLSCGNIVINGGAITATGGRFAAGIGGGHSSSCGNITINYNPSVLYVKATCDSDATPIGAGSSGSSAGNVSVNSGLFDLTRGNTREITKIRSTIVSGTQWDYCLLSDGAFICSRGGGEPQCAVSPKPEGRLAIPATLGGETVVGLGDSAFYYCNSVTGVEIPSTVTFIGDRAFAMCFALEGVVIPSGVTSIGRGAFAGADLSSVELPSGLKNIAPETFNNCDYLVDVSIPGSVTNIGDNAFANCDRLGRVVIPDGVARIGEFAFADSSIAEVVIPPSVVTVERQAFVRTFLTTVYVASNSEVTRVRALLEQGNGDAGQARVPDINNINYIVGGFEEIDGVTWYYLIDEVDPHLTNNNIPTTVTIAKKDSNGNYISAVSPAPTGDVEIPATLGGYTVAYIGEKALNGLTGITSVTIPECVFSIDFAAFAWCTGLESVTFDGDGLDHIGVAAFEGCSSLASVAIPESTGAILERAFGSCTGLREIALPYGNSGLATIGENAFQSCAPTKIYLPDSDNRSIYQGRLVNPGGMSLANATIVYTGCTYDWGGYTWTYSVEDGKIELYNKGDVVVSPSPTGVLEFPNTSNSYIGYPIVSIGENAFNGCSGLTGVVIPSTVTNISSGAFKNCEDLGVLYVSIGDTARVRALLNSDNIDNTGILIVEQGVGYSTDGNYALYYRTYGGGTAEIYNFSGNGNSLAIPDTIGGFTVTSIGAGAFEDAAFTSVTLPSGIAGIGWQAFNNTLQDVYVPAGVSVSDVIDLFSSAAISTSGKKFYGEETVDGVTWYFRVSGSAGSSRFAEVFKGVDTPAFSAPVGTTELTVPATLGGYDVTMIGAFAFYGSSSLTSVDIPSSVTSIGNYAFSGCVNLESIDLPQGLTAIGESLFGGCAKLTEISIPEGVVSIGYYAFNRCSGLETLVIPENVTSIGGRAFWDCTKLTDIMMPASISNIVSNANKNMFDGCSALQTIYVPYGCEDNVWSKLYSFDINTFAVRDGGFEKVGDYTWYYAFNDGGQTVRIERKDKLHNLICAVSPAPTGAVAIPTTLGGYPVTSIGNEAFKDQAITSVTIPDSVTEIKTDAFKSCTSLTEVHFPALATVATGAFQGCNSLETIYIPNSLNSGIMRQRLTSAGLDLDSITVVTTGISDTVDGYTVTWNYIDPPGAENTYVEIADISPKPNGAYTVPSSILGYDVKGIGTGAFADCTSLTEVTLPSTITSIGEDAFNGCDSLTTINVPAGTGAAMTALLEASGLNLAGITVVDPAVPAKTAAQVAAELFDDATINLTGANPSITIKTIPGFTYTVKEGQTLQGMTWKSGEGKVKVGDGNDWSPTLQKYSGSGFYSIEVSETE